MDFKFALLLAMAWLRLYLQPTKWQTPNGALACQWQLGIKNNSYGYTLAVYRVFGPRYVVRLTRSHGTSTSLRTTEDLHSAIRVAQVVQRSYGKATRIAYEHDMRTLAQIAI